MDGQMDKVKGRVKQAVGDLTDNKRLKAVGKAQEFRGNVKNQIDEVAEKLTGEDNTRRPVWMNEGNCPVGR